MTLIDGDKIVTAQLYDDEYEEFTEKKMSIIDFVNAYSDEGVTPADDVLDKIRADIEQIPSELTNDGRRMIRRVSVFRIIEKYKAESEVQDAYRN